jgi:hypothetical protein
MVILHHFQGRKNDEPALEWTLGRMFRYVVIPGRARDDLWATMEREGGVTIDREKQVREMVAA